VNALTLHRMHREGTGPMNEATYETGRVTRRLYIVVLTGSLSWPSTRGCKACRNVREDHAKTTTEAEGPL